LLLINIDGHPAIKTVELVVQKNGKGSFVVVYYKNGKVESYPNPYLSIDRKYLKPNDDWTIMPDNNYAFSFEETNNGLRATLNIEIKNSTPIAVTLQSHASQPKNYSFLAAIGADLKEVKRFPLIYLEQASFLPIENTEGSIQINRKLYPLTKIPIKVEGEKCYKTVYSLKPQPFFWNEERNTDLQYAKYNGKTSDTIDNISYIYNNNQGYTEIKEIAYQLPNSKMNVFFSPALPNFLSLANNIKTEGKFCINVNTNKCVIGGSYTVERTNNDIILHLNPQKGWQPMPGKPWVSFYDYEARFDVSGKTSYQIQSVWDINK